MGVKSFGENSGTTMSGTPTDTKQLKITQPIGALL
jgi:hypothetical protein